MSIDVYFIHLHLLPSPSTNVSLFDLSNIESKRAICMPLSQARTGLRGPVESHPSLRGVTDDKKEAERFQWEASA